MIRALIVDDEPLAREGIRAQLEAEEGVEIVGEAEDGPKAVEAIVTRDPDLVFLDVRMPGFDGFEVMRRVSEKAPLPVVVFVTAHDEYAPEAFDAHALDYLVKPVTTDRFQRALRRAQRELKRTDDLECHRQLMALLESHPSPGPNPSGRTYLRRFPVKRGQRYILLDVEDVDWIRATGNYMEVHIGDRSYLVRTTMSDLENSLDPERFIRIHRSTIINVSRVKEILPNWHGDFDVLLRDGTELRLSRTYRNRLLG